MTKTGKWVLGGLGALFALFVLFWIVVLYYVFSDSDEEVYSSGTGGTIAIVEMKEEIISSENIVRQFKKFREDRSVKAIVFRIETPGGGVSASQEIYEEVKRTRDSGKPVIVSMGSIAASGGYYVACGASRIVANPGTLTGSIGVISQFLHFNQLMDKVGIASTTIKSGKFKDVGSPFRLPTDEEKKYFQEMINDVYAQFLSVVEKERKLSHEKAKALADGRVFSGARAYEVGLVDTLGTYEDAMSIAAAAANITGTPRIVKEKKKERFADYVFGSLASGLREVKQEVLSRPILQYSLTKP
jgi:protease-4